MASSSSRPWPTCPTCPRPPSMASIVRLKGERLLPATLTALEIQAQPAPRQGGGRAGHAGASGTTLERLIDRRPSRQRELGGGHRRATAMISARLQAGHDTSAGAQSTPGRDARCRRRRRGRALRRDGLAAGTPGSRSSRVSRSATSHPAVHRALRPHQHIGGASPRLADSAVLQPRRT